MIDLSYLHLKFSWKMELTARWAKHFRTEVKGELLALFITNKTVIKKAWTSDVGMWHSKMASTVPQLPPFDFCTLRMDLAPHLDRIHLDNTMPKSPRIQPKSGCPFVNLNYNFQYNHFWYLIKSKKMKQDILKFWKNWKIERIIAIASSMC